ncbi:uncharacterized protein LOC123352375 [Mauremys mutica]|uniref:uncharacterized protein LOC123352375 n=1 Tax=Mauremys mutica TaxID=74926 RepID=UPI001D160F0B|nr:uncharacterized protein LOC123352375 [Mauremys mutica]
MPFSEAWSLCWRSRSESCGSRQKGSKGGRLALSVLSAGRSAAAMGLPAHLELLEVAPLPGLRPCSGLSATPPPFCAISDLSGGATIFHRPSATEPKTQHIPFPQWAWRLLLAAFLRHSWLPRRLTGHPALGRQGTKGPFSQAGIQSPHLATHTSSEAWAGTSSREVGMDLNQSKFLDCRIDNRTEQHSEWGTQIPICQGPADGNATLHPVTTFCPSLTSSLHASIQLWLFQWVIPPLEMPGSRGWSPPCRAGPVGLRTVIPK